MQHHTIQLSLKTGIRDIKAEQVAHHTQKFLSIDTGRIKSSKVYSINYELDEKQLQAFAHRCLRDDIVEDIYINQFDDAPDYQSYLAIAKLPGVTDDEGISAQKALCDYLNLDIDTHTQHIFTKDLYYFEKPLGKEELHTIAEKLLGNKLIHHFEYQTRQNGSTSFYPTYVPEVKLTTDASVHTIDLDVSDQDLIKLSKDMLLALTLSEMKAIQKHYRNAEVQAKRKKMGLPLSPTDCELEVLAQTWSEHCKHKEFNAIIQYVNEETGEEKTVYSLFQTYIKGATDVVAKSLKENDNHWLIKVFSDNAGVVQINEKNNFVWKVETHNSPSALDPYGGAITGILGNNRDPLGTGIGGGKLLFNTNVLCFGSPYYDGELLSGQLHPQRIFAGVREGIEDGGNKSGVPTVNGSIIFDERFSGKPLVYCGTGAVMKNNYKGRNSWEKPIDNGDLIIMAGGRVGKDGIHGATFSSVEIDENSPQSAVQIGSPITQKLMGDFLVRACETGLVKCSTDNGAGGLSSSVGELATISNGAIIHLDKVPLKYSGLKPWEIFVSESQERMTLVVEKENAKALFQMAEEMDVELSDIGLFTDNGYLDVRYDENQVAYIDMHFLHEGVPLKYMMANWQKLDLKEPQLADKKNYNEDLLKLLSSLNICSREEVIRQYDHEVKGKTIIKPLMGANGKAPQDAAVMRFDFNSYEGIAISNGIAPQYGDIDAYEMSAGAFDEAVRQIISVGGSLPNLSPGDGIFWSVNDNFCVPDSSYDPETNPDGQVKLAKLVQMCEALYDMATYFDIPLTSGKDSMKNDFKRDNIKISIPPTILYSMTAKLNDVRHTVTSNFKAEGDLIYQLGATYNELGASEYYRLMGELGANVPKVRKADAKALYLKVIAANADQLIESSHDLSDGGLAVAIAESCFGGQLGANISLDAFQNLSLAAILFSETHSRFAVSIRPENKATFEKLMGKSATYLGKVTQAQNLQIQHNHQSIINLSIEQLLGAWQRSLNI